MRSFLLTMILLAASPAGAVAPQFWKVTTPDEMLAGEVEGLSITSNGELRPGPRVEKLASFPEPSVLSQATSPAGVHFFGTGHLGKVYRLDGHELKLLFSAPEPEIYALAWSGGSLMVGSSPNGKVYRVDPGSGKSSVLFDPKVAYIWALASLDDGSIAVATGVEGKLFRVTPDGVGKLWFDAPEMHLRCLAVAGKNRVLAGGSGEGRIYDVTENGGRALFDSPLTEISAIYFDPSTGVGWAAGANAALPAQPPARQPDGAKPQNSQTSSGSAAGEQKKEAEPAPSVDVSVTFDEAAVQAAVQASGSSGELYRIDRDGFVEVKRRFEREVVYAITGGTNGSAILSTGPLGRVYEVRDHDVALIATLPEKQILSFSAEGDALIATTSNNGAIYRITRDPAPKGEFRSAVKDLLRFSRFGRYSVDGTSLEGSKLGLSFRTGNTDTPDATWSSWSALSASREGTIQAPAARYVQWRLNLEQPQRETAIQSVTVAYVNRNVAPLIDDLSVQDPGVIFLGASYPAPPQVVEATNPDEYGIFTSLEAPMDRGGPGKKGYRKGYRTISWKAHDGNGDTLRYNVGFRRVGQEEWLRLRDNLDDDDLNFDTSQLPDGRYQIRLVAGDAIDNPEAPLTDSRIGGEFVVDNTPPTITSTESTEAMVIRATDSLSPIGRAEYSLDAQKWIRMQPDDGIADSREEVFTLKKSDLGRKFVVVRILDTFYNASTLSVQSR
jgi:hypothetical protein